MGRDAFKVLAQWYFKFKILSHKDICAALVCLSRKYSLCIKLNTYHISRRSLQLNIYHVDTFYSSRGPSLLKLPLVNMVSLEDFLKTRKTFPSNDSMQFPWPAPSTATSMVALVCPFPLFKPVGLSSLLQEQAIKRSNRHKFTSSPFKLIQSTQSDKF